MIEIKRYQEKDGSCWDSFIKFSKNGHFLFHRNYMDYHRDRFRDHSLVVYKGDKIIALFPANEKKKDIVSHEGLTFGGLIMHFDIKAIDVLEIFQKIIMYYKSSGFENILYKAVPKNYHKYPSEEDLYALFINKAILYRRDISSVVDLGYPIRFSETKRQSITKCQKKGVSVVESKDFSNYWGLLTDVLKKFNTKPVHSLDEINYLKNLFPENIKLYEARMNDCLLAGVVIYEYNHVVHTQYMANSDKGRIMGVLDFINNNLINEIYKNRKFFSFGISTESDGQILNSGLIQQKEMMGARATTNDFYKINLI